MKNYFLHRLDNNRYSCFLLCLTYDSMLNYLSCIEKESIIKKSAGTLLIDQLLVAGNGKNRFISCEYNFGTIILSTTQNASPDIEHKEISVRFLQQHFELLKNSILSENQRESIQNGLIV